MSVNLTFPFHVRNALIDISNIRNQIDLVIAVSDARSLETTNLQDKLEDLFRNKKTKILSLISKSDLSDTKFPNSFDFTNLKSRDPIIRLIKKTLNTDSFYKQGYKPYFQVLVAGMPNTGKSTLINLLKSKKVTLVENIPGKTRKISKFPLVDNIWIYDTPGILIKKNLTNESFNKLFVLNAAPIQIKDHTEILKTSYTYLRKHYLREMCELIGKEVPKDYQCFLSDLASKYKFMSIGDNLDIERAENKFLYWLRSGKFKLNWDRD